MAAAPARNVRYAAAQIVLLSLFALTYVLGARPRLLPAGGWIGIAGLAVSLGGLLLMLLGLRDLGRALQVAPQPKAGAELVTRGVYARFRHPMYSGIALVVAGLFLRRGTLPVAIAAAVVIGFLVVKSRYEESLLVARYPEYPQYRRRTWGVIPWPARRT